MDHVGPKKKAHPHNFGSAVRIILKFCTIKGANREMKVIIMVCTKKNCSGQMGPKMTHPNNSGSALRIFLKFCRMKGSNRYMKILVVFREKNSFGVI